mgnify:FL=1
MESDFFSVSWPSTPAPAMESDFVSTPVPGIESDSVSAPSPCYYAYYATRAKVESDFVSAPSPAMESDFVAPAPAPMFFPGSPGLGFELLTAGTPSAMTVEDWVALFENDTFSFSLTPFSSV